MKIKKKEAGTGPIKKSFLKWFGWGKATLDSSAEAASCFKQKMILFFLKVIFIIFSTSLKSGLA